jgi:hypothetical protein
MAASIGSVFVDFEARTAKLKEGASDAVNTVKKSGEEMGKSNAAVGDSGSKMAAAMEQAGLRIGVGLLGARSVTMAAANELKDIYKNIDNIPGVPQATIDSIHRMKFALEGSNMSIKGAIATMLAWYSDFGTGIGFALGELVYGSEAAKAAQKSFNNEAAAFAHTGYLEKLAAVTEEMNRLSVGTAGKMAKVLADEGAALSNFAKTGKLEIEGLNNAYLENLKIRTAAQGGATQTERDDAKLRSMKDIVEVQRTINTLNKELTAEQSKWAGKVVKEGFMGMPTKAAIREVEKEIEQLVNIWGRGPKIGADGSDVSKKGMTPEQLERAVEAWKRINVLETSHEHLLAKIAAQYDQWVKVVGDGLTNAFVDTLNGAGNAWSKFGNIIKLELEKMLVKLLIIVPLFEMIGGGLVGAGFKDAGAAVLRYGGGKAGGGDIRHGEFAMVGENGPELFAQPGTIVSRDSIGAALGRSGNGGGAIYNIDARGADTTAVARLEATIIALNGSIERRAVAANIAASRRGGSLARGLAA